MRKVFHETCTEGKEVDPKEAQRYYDKGWVDSVEQVDARMAKAKSRPQTAKPMAATSEVADLIDASKKVKMIDNPGEIEDDPEIKFEKDTKETSAAKSKKKVIKRKK